MDQTSINAARHLEGEGCGSWAAGKMAQYRSSLASKIPCRCWVSTTENCQVGSKMFQFTSKIFEKLAAKRLLAAALALPQKWVTWERNHPPGKGISTEKHHFLGPLEWCIICTQLLGKSWKITVLISALWGSRSHCIPGYPHFLSHG